MPIVLYRVDERLIHGQVVVGWGTELRPDCIVVVDDELATSAWEQDLYSLGLPARLSTRFAAVEEARASIQAWRDSAERILLLTRDVRTMERLADGGLLQGEEVNIGGIHHAPGRTSVLPYVFLSDAERAEIGRLTDQGVAVSARDVPGARRVDLGELLKREKT
jgi:mannose/fructose/N-acetylgalactosamine-specific phosphotransferase system component IIB